MFQLGQSELSSYQLVVEEGPGHDPGRGVVRLNDVVSQVHPVLVELHSGKVTFQSWWLYNQCCDQCSAQPRLQTNPASSPLRPQPWCSRN